MRKRNERAYIANWIVYCLSIFAFVFSVTLMAFAGFGKTGLILDLTVMYVSACAISKTETNLKILAKRLDRS